MPNSYDVARSQISEIRAEDPYTTSQPYGTEQCHDLIAMLEPRSLTFAEAMRELYRWEAELDRLYAERARERQERWRREDEKRDAKRYRVGSTAPPNDGRTKCEGQTDA